MKIIFDIGANKGQNINYFINKADVVIAFEANPILAKSIKSNYKKFIDKKKLIVENIALIDNNNEEKVDFFISKTDNVLSTLHPADKKKFYKLKIKAKKASFAIQKYLNKFNTSEIEYIKIDVENSDQFILKDLFQNNIFANNLSVECLVPEVIKLILDSPYKSFKFIECETIGRLKNLEIKTINKKRKIISFEDHSSGPYGNDIPGNYYGKSSIIPYFLNNGLGWKDIHCKIKEYKNLQTINYHFNFLKKKFRNRLIFFFYFCVKNYLIKFLKNLIKNK